jgi:hypothetical protein
MISLMNRRTERERISSSRRPFILVLIIIPVPFQNLQSLFLDFMKKPTIFGQYSFNPTNREKLCREKTGILEIQLYNLIFLKTRGALKKCCRGGTGS